MKLSLGQLVIMCGAVLVVLVMLNVLVAAAVLSPDEIGHVVTNALDRSGDEMSQTAVQICVGFLNAGSCRSEQSLSKSPSQQVAKPFSNLPFYMIIAAGLLSIIFLAWIGYWLLGPGILA